MRVRIVETTDGKHVGKEVEYEVGKPIKIGKSFDMTVEKIQFSGKVVILSNSNYVIISEYGEDN